MDAENVYVYLFQIGDDWKFSQDETTKNYKIEGAKFADTKEPNPKELKIAYIAAPSKEIGIAGEQKIISWILEAPSTLPKGETFNYPVKTRVCYDYTTTAVGKVEVISEDEWLLEQTQGRISQKPITTSQTSGPIQIGINSMQPIIEAQEITLEININNIGGGYVSANPCESFGSSGVTIEKLNKIVLNKNDCSVDKDLYLERGKSKEFTVTCSGFTTDGLPKKTKDLELEFEYSYYIDAEAGISVTGTEKVTAPPEVEEEEEILPISLPIHIKEDNCAVDISDVIIIEGPNNVGCNEIEIKMDLVIPKDSSNVFEIYSNRKETTITYGKESFNVPLTGSVTIADLTCVQNDKLVGYKYKLVQETPTDPNKCDEYIDIVYEQI